MRPEGEAVFAGAAAVSGDATSAVYMHCRIPGRQTVPRAELTALLKTIRCIRVARKWSFYIDAQYVINGLTTSDRSYYRLGSNGDLWRSIYNELDRLAGEGIADIEFIKVKSHVTSQSEWGDYNMTQEKLIYNELPDEAARIGATQRTSNSTLLQNIFTLLVTRIKPA